MRRIFTLSKNLWKGLSNLVSSRNVHDSYFAALFYVKNTSAELKKEVEEVLLILENLEDLNQKASSIFQNIAAVNQLKSCELFVNRIDDQLIQIMKQFIYLQDNMHSKSKIDDSLFWQQIDDCLNIITSQVTNLQKIGIDHLSNQDRKYWIDSVHHLQVVNLTVLASRISICRQQFDFSAQRTGDIVPG